VQKVLNRWLPVCFDLFGHERSRGAGNAYQWGLKGRFNEEDAGPMKDPQAVNEAARELYYKEVQGLVAILNKEIGTDQTKLYVPDIRFRRGIGEYKGQRFSVTGETLEEDAYGRHLEEVLPTEKDREALRTIAREPDWIAP
jgi:benzoyl-CoA 2,3-dioxygenase component B